MTAERIARCTANGSDPIIYRHSRTGESIIVECGECLPHCEGEGDWYPLTTDNINPAELQPIVIGDGSRVVIQSGPLMEGEEINILCTFVARLSGSPFGTGRYRITGTKLTSWYGKTGLHVGLEPAGELDMTKLVHLIEPYIR